MKNKKIFVVGDIHGDWSSLNKLISRHKPNIILQCGDFGWWPKWNNTSIINDGVNYKKKWNQYGIKNGDCKIYWCDGNHEDHWDLEKYKEQTEVMPNIFYMPRGSVLELPDGRNVLFVGGALSVDKKDRKLGYDWFPEEEISYKTINNLPDCKIDIVISHTCATSFREVNEFCMFKHKDSSSDALDYVLRKYNPPLWYFGHFHFYQRGKFKDTQWFCLNTNAYSYWWRTLEE